MKIILEYGDKDCLVDLTPYKELSMIYRLSEELDIQVSSEDRDEDLMVEASALVKKLLYQVAFGFMPHPNYEIGDLYRYPNKENNEQYKDVLFVAEIYDI